MNPWLNFLILMILVVAGAVGVITGHGFRGNPTWKLRVAAMVPFAVLYLVYVATCTDRLADSLHAAAVEPVVVSLLGACLFSLAIIGMCVLWSLLCGASRNIFTRLFGARGVDGHNTDRITRSSAGMNSDGDLLAEIDEQEVERGWAITPVPWNAPTALTRPFPSVSHKRTLFGTA